MTASDDYKRIVGPVESRMIRTAWRILRNPHDAEDAFQEAVACIWQRWTRLCRHPNPQALILRICINSAYDILRKRIPSGPNLLEVVQDVGTAEMSPDRRLTLEEDCARVLVAIGQLPRSQALTVFLRTIEDEPYAKIAEILGCSEATARTHFKRGTKRLRLTLKLGSASD